ncbi:hypothetical protein Ae201684P_006702 [Aphanomyces euteiches]|nr:hypothetical protein Ae201684P_006702 [Aphanomyces euteiches]
MSQPLSSPPVYSTLQGPGSPQDVSSVAPLPGIFLVSGKLGDNTNSPEHFSLPQDNESDDEAPFDAGTPGPFSNDPLEELKNQVNHINHLLVRLDKQDAAIIEINDRLTAQTATTERLDRQVIQQKSSIDNVANSVVQYGRAVCNTKGGRHVVAQKSNFAACSPTRATPVATPWRAVHIGARGCIQHNQLTVHHLHRRNTDEPTE